MTTLSLIGIGCGDPGQLTRAAIDAINAADLVLIPRKGTAKSDLADLRRTICADVLTNDTTRIAEFDLPVRDAGEADYRKGVDDWHDAVAGTWSQTIADHLGGNGKVALLVWGDPSLCAAHALPLNDIGEPFLVTTGRRLREGGWPVGVDTVVVMLDGGTAFQSLDPAGLHIWWGAYLGMSDQIIMSGALTEVGARIVASRQAARGRHGWIMDSYILKRRP
jgi:precorrin-6A synthase